MKKIFQLTSILALLPLLVFSCAKNEVDTDQYDTSMVVLQAYGPQPVVRGGTLRFVGSNLDKVVSVTIPEDNVITDIEVVSSGVHSEIRVTVPKETAAPGYPVLTLADGKTITGKTMLTYSEPITLESFSPAEILPGEVLTIQGDYLNLIHEVVFSDDVKVSETAFSEHTRYSIKLTVPETAQTGKISVGTIDETAIAGTEDEEALLATLNLVQSDEALVVTTAKGTLAATSVKAGATVTINGTNLTLAKSIVLEGATVTDFTATATKITFALPAAATDGDVVMVMASGVEVSAGTLTTVVPTGLSAAPAPVKNGATLTISGTDLDLVTGIELPNAGRVEFENGTAITLTVPEKAQAGDAVLHLENGKSVTIAYTLVEPVVTAFSANPASAGSDLTITGTDLDLVASVTFPGADAVAVEATETTIVVSVPTAADTGNMVLGLKNGASVEVGTELAIDKPAGAYIAVFPDTVYAPGDVFIVEIENPDHLTGVLIDGVEVNYILSGDMIYVQIPTNAKAGSQITLVSDNGSVTYTMNIDPGDIIETELWSGEVDLGLWSINWEIPADTFTKVDMAVGQTIRIYVEQTADWWQIQFFDGHWSGLVVDESTDGTNNINTDKMDISEGFVSLVVTEDLKEKFTTLTDWGYCGIIQGEGLILKKITYYEDYSIGAVAWEGEVDLGLWSINWEIPPATFTAVGLAVGQTIRYYVEPTADWWQIQFFDGHWSGLVVDESTDGTNNINTDKMDISCGYIPIKVTEDIQTKYTTLTDWGYCGIIQGESLILKKITVK